MICEAIEAAVRSIKNPDIMKIEAMIDKIIKQRIDDQPISLSLDRRGGVNLDFSTFSHRAEIGILSYRRGWG